MQLQKYQICGGTRFCVFFLKSGESFWRSISSMTHWMCLDASGIVESATMAILSSEILKRFSAVPEIAQLSRSFRNKKVWHHRTSSNFGPSNVEELEDLDILEWFVGSSQKPNVKLKQFFWDSRGSQRGAMNSHDISLQQVLSSSSEAKAPQKLACQVPPSVGRIAVGV